MSWCRSRSDWVSVKREDGIAEDVAAEVVCEDLHEAMSAADDAAPSLDNIGLVAVDFVGDIRKTLGASMGSLGYIDFVVPVGNVDSLRKDSGEPMPICGPPAVRRIFWGVTGAESKAFPSSPSMFRSCSELDGIEKSVSTDVMEVPEDSGNNIEFCRVDGIDESVSVSTATKGQCKCICETNHGDLHVSTKGDIRNSNEAQSVTGLTFNHFDIRVIHEANSGRRDYLQTDLNTNYLNKICPEPTFLEPDAAARVDRGVRSLLDGPAGSV